MSEDVEGNWLDLVINSDYEIYDQYPYPIRKKLNGRILKECINGSGYIHIAINLAKITKHRIIALQFIENDDPENKTQVDHIDRNKLNNIENLRWCTASDNCKNKVCVKRPAEYLDKMPENAMLFEEYRNNEFDKYYFDSEEDRILLLNKYGRIKVIRPYGEKENRITLYDINGKARIFMYNTLMDYLHSNY